MYKISIYTRLGSLFFLWISLFWILKYKMMPLKSVTDSVFPNANWILHVLNAASNTDVNWVWGCRIFCKKKYHNQRAKDFLEIFFPLNYIGPMTYVLRRYHGPSYLKTRPFSTHLQTARGLLHKNEGALFSVAPQKKETSSLGVSAKHCIWTSPTDKYWQMSLCTSVSSGDPV